MTKAARQDLPHSHLRGIDGDGPTHRNTQEQLQMVATNCPNPQISVCDSFKDRLSPRSLIAPKSEASTNEMESLASAEHSFSVGPQ